MYTYEDVESPVEKAQRLVRYYIIGHLDPSALKPSFKTHIVWFNKTLQNWKALVITDLPDRMMYEVTYNGNLMESYIDAYRKVDAVYIRDGDVDPNEFVDKYSVPRISDSSGIQYGSGNNQVNTFRN